MAPRGQQLPLFKQDAVRRRATNQKRGRNARPDRVGFVKHVTRPTHFESHPVHVTIRRVRLGPGLRTQLVFSAIMRELVAVKARGVRVVHFAVQHDHLHLLVESPDRQKLSRQMQLLFSRIARSVNRVAKRRGSLFRDRHHRHDLRTPTETRRALVYVLFNSRKHEPSYRWLDEFTSMRWFHGWSPESAPPPSVLARHGPFAPVSEPRTWLANVGWRRAPGGALRFDELPSL